MPKNLKAENEKLIHLLVHNPDGLSLEELLSHLPEPIPKRTLQYRLYHLVKRGLIEKRGAGKGSRYYFKREVESQKEERVGQFSQKGSVIPLSKEGREMQELISMPIQSRHYVGYQREFLYNYIPNQTFYLSAEARGKLLRLGPGLEEKHPAGTYVRKIYGHFLVDLTWNSSRLEGNTYSRLETENLVIMGEEAAGKDWTEAQMILNHKKAIEFLVDMAEEVKINSYTILNIHGLLAHNLLPDSKTYGRLRTIPVRIGKSVYLPVEVPQLVEEYFHLIIHKAGAIVDPFEQSFFLMIHLPYLQPFVDVNTRVSRIVGNVPFIRENLCPLSFCDVPEKEYVQGLLAVYELNRIELFRDVFLWAYERSASKYRATAEVIRRPDPFRLRYDQLISRAVFETVQQKMNPLEASSFIEKFAEKYVPIEDRNYFIEKVRLELKDLHEGNLQRFQISLALFSAWKEKNAP